MKSRDRCLSYGAFPLQHTAIDVAKLTKRIGQRGKIELQLAIDVSSLPFASVNRVPRSVIRLEVS